MQAKATGSIEPDEEDAIGNLQEDKQQTHSVSSNSQPKNFGPSACAETTQQHLGDADKREARATTECDSNESQIDDSFSGNTSDSDCPDHIKANPRKYKRNQALGTTRPTDSLPAKTQNTTLEQSASQNVPRQPPRASENRARATTEMIDLTSEPEMEAEGETKLESIERRWQKIRPAPVHGPATAPSVHLSSLSKYARRLYGGQHAPPATPDTNYPQIISSASPSPTPQYTSPYASPVLQYRGDQFVRLHLLPPSDSLRHRSDIIKPIDAKKAKRKWEYDS
jgi:hypothetical protein